jgi:enoyl-[acyl-carrier protein] reductase II
LIKNKFFEAVETAQNKGATAEELVQLLGRARAKKGMFEGDLEEGELEIGQVSGMINEIKSAAEVVDEIYGGFKNTVNDLSLLRF